VRGYAHTPKGGRRMIVTAKDYKRLLELIDRMDNYRFMELLNQLEEEECQQ